LPRFDRSGGAAFPATVDFIFDPPIGHLTKCPSASPRASQANTRASNLPDALMLDIASAAPLRILLTHIAAYDPKSRAPVARMAKAEGARLASAATRTRHSSAPTAGSPCSKLCRAALFHAIDRVRSAGIGSDR
jgi:hypothetical protein